MVAAAAMTATATGSRKQSNWRQSNRKQSDRKQVVAVAAGTHRSSNISNHSNNWQLPPRQAAVSIWSF